MCDRNFFLIDRVRVQKIIRAGPGSGPGPEMLGPDRLYSHPKQTIYVIDDDKNNDLVHALAKIFEQGGKGGFAILGF